MNDIWTALEGLRDTAVVADGRLYADRWAARRKQRRRVASLCACTAAVAVAAAAAWGLVNGPITARTYATAVGETRDIVLADGSRVKLDSDSRLRAQMTRTRRLVDLERGQASFAVVKDARHPFRVRAGSSETTALGTLFNVSQSPYETEVTLLEGRVKVRGAISPAERVLQPGEQLALSPEGRLGATRNAPIDQVTAWQRGHVDLEDVSLERALYEVNRYSRTKVVLVDPQFADVHISGLLTAGDAESAAATINSYFGRPAVRLVPNPQ